LAKIARQLSVFKLSMDYPLVFVIEAIDASEEEIASIYSLIVSYVIRRTLWLYREELRKRLSPYRR